MAVPLKGGSSRCGIWARRSSERTSANVPTLKSIHVDSQHTEAARTATGTTATPEATATTAAEMRY